ncbi:ribosome maturation factor RimM [Raineyella fluvialis]|uniref:Ribosome maturation factor RimM n=1 Tax=Raineyella fluvialis TaxID=2662261 RepID=A0A5Q2FGI5_9ACTN|nr:ribosome maturation factor RimM [Raineyella fluvialis]QGF24907.1 ribosome maturation factor RimM [Raineyella fluvialis]
MSETTTVVVGRIGKPHGIRGEVTLELRTDEPERRFAPGERLVVEGSGRSLTVTGHHWHQGRLLVKFEELADRTAAETARGWILTAQVDATALPEEDDSYYDRQLIGLRVLTADGAEAGTVAFVVHLPAQDVLEITTPGGTRLVPFVSALVPTVDLAAGTVTLADVPGLLEDVDDSEGAEDVDVTPGEEAGRA